MVKSELKEADEWLRIYELLEKEINEFHNLLFFYYSPHKSQGYFDKYSPTDKLSKVTYSHGVFLITLTPEKDEHGYRLEEIQIELSMKRIKLIYKHINKVVEAHQSLLTFLSKELKTKTKNFSEIKDELLPLLISNTLGDNE